MSLLEYLREDPGCSNLVRGAIHAVAPLLADPDPAPVELLLSQWAFELAGRMPLPWSFHGAIDALNHYLFVDQGLKGDRETYDDPLNALVPVALVRRRGLPITLSILWIDVARRMGFDASGVALPGHFITSLRLDLGRLFFDPFNGGRPVGEERAMELVDRATGGRAVFDPSMLVPATDRAILVRLVRNLHLRFVRLEDWEDALWTSTHLILLEPGEGIHYRDRAFIRLQRGETREGILDLQEAIRLTEDVDPALVQWMTRLQQG
jgi:regulator of sirC expression with transglutaminase-like and TPR domain